MFFLSTMWHSDVGIKYILYCMYLYMFAQIYLYVYELKQMFDVFYLKSKKCQTSVFSAIQNTSTETTFIIH